MIHSWWEVRVFLVFENSVHAFLILEFQWGKVNLGCILTGLLLVILTHGNTSADLICVGFFVCLLHTSSMVRSLHGCVLLDLGVSLREKKRGREINLGCILTSLPLVVWDHGAHDCRYNRERKDTSQRLAWMRDAAPLINGANNSYGTPRRVYVTNSYVYLRQVYRVWLWLWGQVLPASCRFSTQVKG